MARTRALSTGAACGIALQNRRREDRAVTGRRRRAGGRDALPGRRPCALSGRSLLPGSGRAQCPRRGAYRRPSMGRDRPPDPRVAAPLARRCGRPGRLAIDPFSARSRLRAKDWLTSLRHFRRLLLAPWRCLSEATQLGSSQSPAGGHQRAARAAAAAPAASVPCGCRGTCSGSGSARPAPEGRARTPSRFRRSPPPGA